MPHPSDSRRSADELRRIARYHRWVIAIFLAEAALWLGFLALAAMHGDVVFEAFRVPVFLTFALGGVGGIFVFLLYWTLRGPLTAIVMGLGSVPPCIGLLTFLAANATAAAALRTHGIEVGLLGARDSNIPTDRALYDLDEDEGW
jgi:hypothetical protein